MQISIGNGTYELVFGRGMICESLEADGLTYGDEFPARDVSEKTPLVRRLRLEGYIVSGGATPEERRREMEERRLVLGRITSPSGKFFIKIGDRRAYITCGELVFHRKAPFSGDTAEHFTLTGVIDGGFFSGDTVTVFPREGVVGTNFPLVSEGGIALGGYDGASALHVMNRGDIAAGFTAELSPETAVNSFTLRNLSTGQRISVNWRLGAGESICISTHRDNLSLTLKRGSLHVNLSGYADEHSEMFRLPPGESILTVGTGAPFSGSLTFTEAFVNF